MSAVSSYYRNFARGSTRLEDPNMEMSEKYHALSFLGRRPQAPRPLSQATVFQDTDDEEDEETFEEPQRTNSTPRSMLSMDEGSLTTASSSGPPSPPPTGGLGGFDFHFDDKPIQGPIGPHIFQNMSEALRELASPYEAEFLPQVSPISFKETILSAPLTSEPIKSPMRTFSTLPQAISELDAVQVRSWTPRQVANWMRSESFEDDLVAKFLGNDISGSVLLDLQHGDLKELDITSGSRSRVMSSIQHLRNSSIEPISRPTSRGRQSRALQRAVAPEEAQVMVYQTEDGPRTTSASRTRKSSRPRRAAVDIISPAESVSIVAIEQLLPKPHKCSKGEDCAKWRKQQKKLKRYQEEFARYDAEIEQQANAPLSAQSAIFRPKSEAEPSVVASSDVLGPGSDFGLTAHKLEQFQSHDPQDSLRQFLNFQHVRSTSNNPSPPPAPSASFRPVSPPRTQTPAPLAEHLRSLPKLTIPVESTENQIPSVRSPVSALRGPNHYLGVQSHLLAQLQRDPYHYGGVASPADIYRIGTPASAADVPMMTSYPVDILPRDASQSVPPDMRFGGELSANPTIKAFTPISRPASTQPQLSSIPLPPPPNPSRSLSIRHTRRPSFAPTIAPVSETPQSPPATISATAATPTPLAAASTIRRTSTAPPPQNPSTALPQRLEDVYHSGWMRKRKTTAVLRRHEWSDNYIRLRGTQLTAHDSADPTARPMDRIDVDEYAIACQSLASSSKLSAAFKKSILGSSYRGKSAGPAGDADATTNHAFAFSLIPDGEKSKKIFTTSKGESHHFAVQSRDERIEWMRDLMLAKALKRAGGERGCEVRVTGNVI